MFSSTRRSTADGVPPPPLVSCCPAPVQRLCPGLKVRRTSSVCRSPSAPSPPPSSSTQWSSPVQVLFYRCGRPEEENMNRTSVDLLPTLQLLNVKLLNLCVYGNNFNSLHVRGPASSPHLHVPSSVHCTAPSGLQPGSEETKQTGLNYISKTDQTVVQSCSCTFSLGRSLLVCSS